MRARIVLAAGIAAALGPGAPVVAHATIAVV